MRIGISGKGGVGKSTIAAVLARTMARQGHEVVAIDCDSDPNLGLSIGLGEEAADGIRPLLDQSGAERHLPSDLTARELLEDYGRTGPDNITVVLGARSEKAGAG
ncbi:MAG: AAA family ATPase [Acidimicrobiales bacterium]